MSGIPTPPLEDHIKSTVSRKSSSKSTKSMHRASKRASLHSHTQPSHHEHSSHSVMDGRHRRVWKACERCRMKKTKCDGEFPCKRCKDDGLVCTAGTRKKTEYKQLPKGYAEVLENTQFALIATVHKLYAMVRTSQPWELGEPELNDRGQPVIHDIASKLGCIRPNSDMDLPAHSIFPEDEGGLAELAAQLEAQQQETGSQSAPSLKVETDSSCHGSDRASSSELDHSDIEHDYRRSAFGGSNAMTMSPQSFTSYNDFDVSSVPSDIDPNSNMFPAQSPTYSNWVTSNPQFIQSGGYMNVDLLNRGLLESEFGTIKPHVISCPNPEAMMGIGDPMIYQGYEGESMRL